MNDILNDQIKETMQKAFWDLIKDDLKAEPQRFDHLIKLIVEIRERLKTITPNRKDLHKEFDENLDDAFLKHLFKEKSLGPEHFFNLIMFLINKIKIYIAPYMDKDVDRWEIQVTAELHNGIEYSEFIPKFFLSLYNYIQIIEDDIDKFKRNNT